MISFARSGPGPTVVALLAVISWCIWSHPAQAEPDRGDFHEIGVRDGPGVVRPWLVPTVSGFLAGWNADGQVVLRALDDDGRPRAPATVLELPSVTSLLPVQEGALVIGPDRLIAVDELGQPLARARLFDGAPVGIYRGFAHGPDGLLAIALARAEGGARLTSVLFDPANGRRLHGQFAIDVGDAYVVALDVALLLSGGALHPSVVAGANGTIVGWVSGVRFGLFARSGRGVLALRRAGGRGPVRRLETPDGIERVGLAADPGRLAAVVLRRDAEGAQATRIAARGFARLE